MLSKVMARLMDGISESEFWSNVWDKIEGKLVYSKLHWGDIYPLHNIGMNMFFYKMGEKDGYYSLLKKTYD